MNVIEGRSLRRGEVGVMAGSATSRRYEVVPEDSSLTFFALSSAQSAYGKTTGLSGFIDAAWNGDGTIAKEPAPHMHVEFKVESLRTGNDLQDREMWKLIDSKRFPKIAGDLRTFAPSTVRGRYTAAGQITFAGLARAYEGEFRVERDGKRIVLDGELMIDVRDFGLKPINLLVLSVAPLVRVRLHLVTAQVA